MISYWKCGKCALVLLLVSAAVVQGQGTEFLYTYTFVTTDSLGSPGNPGATASFSYPSTARLNNDLDFRLSQDELLEGTVEFFSDGSSSVFDITNPNEVNFSEQPLTGLPLGQLSLLAPANPIPSEFNILSAFGETARTLGTTGGFFGSNPFTGGPFTGEWSLTSIPIGDYDFDGDVDGSDFLNWQRNDGSALGLANWQSNFGNPGAPGLASSQAVPEPATLGLLLLATTLAACQRGRRSAFTR